MMMTTKADLLGHHLGHLDQGHLLAHPLLHHPGQDQGHHQGQEKTEREVGGPGQGNSRVSLVKVKRSLSFS